MNIIKDAMNFTSREEFDKYMRDFEKKYFAAL